MRMGKEKIRNGISLFIKRVTAFCLIAALLLPAVAGMSVQAFYDEDDSGFYVDEETKTVRVFDASKFSLDKVTTEIQNLYFIESNISELDLSSISVKELEFDRCNISSIKLPKETEFLRLDDSKIDYSILNNSKISEVKFLNTRFDDLKKVGTLTNLDSFIFDDCTIKSTNGIEKLRENLIVLGLVNTNVEDISFVRQLPNMQIFTLYNSYVEDISPLINHPSLYFLDLSQNSEIRSLEPIMKIPKLEQLLTINTQMALTDKTYNYIKNNIPVNTLNDDDLSVVKQVKELARKITNDKMTEEEKIEAVVGYTVNHIEYDDRIYEDRDLQLEYHDHALRYALKGKGLCKNYSILIDALLKEVGVTCYEIRNYDHIWNLVNCNGKYYWIDGTFINTIWLAGNPTEDFRNSPDYMVEYNDKEFISNHYHAVVPFTVEFGSTKKPTVTKTASVNKTEETMQTDSSEASLSQTKNENSDAVSVSTSETDSTEISTTDKGKTESAGLTKNTEIIIIVVSVSTASAIAVVFAVIYIKKKKKS